ncbi:hypothetical protein SBA3_2400016 [Candidatus Sulfopaludibacter sp. SbA3]|nr:hypothetical protein SBA3_2400016 [Candidatus Sulfopaludibacter sp. SbA3]
MNTTEGYKNRAWERSRLSPGSKGPQRWPNKKAPRQGGVELKFYNNLSRRMTDRYRY